MGEGVANLEDDRVSVDGVGSAIRGAKIAVLAACQLELVKVGVISPSTALCATRSRRRTNSSITGAKIM